MGTQQNGIIILGIVLALVVVLYIAFRNFNLGDALGLQKAQEDFNNFAKSIESGFNDIFGGLFEVDNSSSIAGETVATEGLGDVTIPEDTIVNPDGTVESSTPPTFELSLTQEDKIRALFDSNKRLLPIIENLQSEFTQEDLIDTFGSVKEANKLVFGLDVPRDDDGFAFQGFRPREIELRLTQQVLNKKRSAFRDLKSGKVISFGGFKTAKEQELELRRLFEENRAKFPTAFAKASQKKTSVN